MRQWHPLGIAEAHHGTNRQHRVTPGPGNRPPVSPGGADQDRPRSLGGDGESDSGRQLVQPASEWRKPPSDPDYLPHQRWLESQPARDHGAPYDRRGGGGRSRAVDAIGKSSRQPSATLLAASRNDGSASPGSHPLSETMLSGSTSGVGLIRAFHEWSPVGRKGSARMPSRTMGSTRMPIRLNRWVGTDPGPVTCLLHRLRAEQGKRQP